MSELYYGIEVYIPEICHEAVRRGNHYECSSGCKQLNKKEQYICPCFGKDGNGWIPVSKEKEQELINEVNRWNKCREKIPNRDAYHLKGIKYFDIGKLDLMVRRFPEKDTPKVMKAMMTLFNAGDRVRFNEEHGVGNILDNGDGTYTVEKYCYHNKSTPVVNGSLEDVFRFLFEFWGE